MRRTKTIALMVTAPLAIVLLIALSGCYGGYAENDPGPDGQVVVAAGGYGGGGYDGSRGGGDDRGRNDDSHSQVARGGVTARPAAVASGRKEPSKKVRPSGSEQASPESSRK